MVLWMGPILLCYNFLFPKCLETSRFYQTEDHCHFEVAISPYKNFTKELRTSGFYQTYCMKSSLLIQGYSEDTISLVMKVD